MEDARGFSWLFSLQGAGLLWFLLGAALVLLCWAGWLWVNRRARALERAGHVLGEYDPKRDRPKA